MNKKRKESCMLSMRNSLWIQGQTGWNWKNESESVKIVQINGNQMKIGVAILMLDKVEFKSKTVSTDKIVIT